MKLINHIVDLRRRRVFRAAGLYLVGSWLLLQVGDVIVEPAGLPDWSLTVLLYILAGFFPVALFLGWRYELTEQGLVKTRSLQEEDVANLDVSLTGKDYFLITALIIVSGVLVYQVLPDVGKTPEMAATTSESSTELNTIAVLPFADLSINQDQGYLSDGVAEEILNALS